MDDIKKKVLITDGLASEAIKMLEEHFTVVEEKGISPERLKEIIPDYNALITRSATWPDADII